MKRAVICSKTPELYINQLTDYSIMVVNPDAAESRRRYLLDNSDYSLLITDTSTTERSGNDYPGERLLWYTSGTTGDSKFCSFTQAQLDTMAETISCRYNLTPNDRYVSIMPLWHAHGQGMYWAAKAAGVETNFLNIKNIKSILDYDPTYISAIPAFLNTLSRFNFESLRFIRSASSGLPPSLYQILADKFQVPVIEAFGMTEAMSHCFSNPLTGQQRVGTVGLPDGVDAEIRNGVLHIKGPCITYPGWYDTGDLAEQDQEGYYKILGRARDQLNINGIKFNPASLENQILEALPTVSECVIFGNTTVKCLFVGTASSAEVTDFLISLSKECRPKFIQSVDVIPVGSAGKLSRTWLDSQYS